MARNDDPVEVNATYLRPAGGAIVIEDCDGKEHLLPTSQIALDPEDPDAYDNVTITMPEWLAEREGLV